MDLKKLSFPDQFPYSSSIRRKVVSGLSLGVVVSLLFLSVLLFNFSFKAPFLNPIFQGFKSFSSNSSSISNSWHFPFSSTTSSPSPSPSSSSVNDSSTANITATKLHNPVDSMQSGKTHEANASEIGSNGNFMNYSGKGMDLEDTRLSNSSEKVKNKSFTVDENVIGEKSIEGKFEERNVNESSVGESFGSRPDLSPGIGKSGITSADKISNLTNKGENVGTLGKEERGSEMNNRVVSSDKINATISHNDSQILKVHKTSLGICNIFDGRWIRDDTKPYYPAGSCPHIDRDFDCYLNRRPDDGFVKWRWQPNGCDIPSLNATDFLQRLRGKKLVFVGDSLNRNMWESLVCILRHSVKNKKRVYEISGKREFKKKGFYAFRFEDYNCTVDFVSSPFLVRESSYNGKNGSLETLRLDLMDRTTSMYHDADILVFNTGHWWTHEKTSKGEDYYQEGNLVHPRLKVLEAYKRALVTWARWVDKNIDGKRTQVIFRGYSVTHFRGGFWNSGGQCHKETEPILNDTHLAKYPSKMRALEYVLRDMKTPVIYLNISRLTDYRKDAHPSIYRMEYKTQEEQIAAVHSQDCSHWCLPGVPDTWNELLYASLLKIGTGSWRT